MNYIITDETITAVINGKSHTIRRDHANAKMVINAIAEGRAEGDIEELMDITKALNAYLGNNV